MRVLSSALVGRWRARRWFGAWWNDDQGSILPLASLFMVGLMLIVAVIGVSTEHYARSAKAQWAADAAALAAAGSGLTGTDEQAARVLAEANGATLLSVEVGDGSHQPTILSPIVVVTIELDGLRAQAAAQRFATGGS